MQPSMRISAVFLLSALALGLSISSFVAPTDASFQCHHHHHHHRRRHQMPIVNRGLTSSFPKLYAYGQNRIESQYDDDITQILRRYGFGSRLTTLNNANLSTRPMPAELYEGGGWKLCLILGLRPPASGGNEKPPLLDVLAMDGDGLFQEKKIVDIGQFDLLS